MPRQVKEYDLTKGVSRTFSRLELPPGFVRDCLNVLPRVPGGVQAILGDAHNGAWTDPAESVVDVFPYYAATGFFWVIRTTAKYYYSSTGSSWTELTGAFPTTTTWAGGTAYVVGDLVILSGGTQVYYCILANTGNTPPNTTYWAPVSGLHSMTLYKGLLVIAEEGKTLKTWDGVGSAVTELTDSPKGGLATEFAGRLCSLGECAPPAFTAMKLSVVGTGVPLTSVTKPAVGAGTIAAGVISPNTAYSASSAYKVGDVVLYSGTVYTCSTAIAAPGEAWTVGHWTAWTNDYWNGKLVALGGTAIYKITDSTTTTFTVQKQDANPSDSTSAVPFEIYGETALLQVYPGYAAAVDFGQAGVGADSGPVTLRLHNRSSVPVRVVDIRVKGADFRIESMPNMPATVPPGSTLAFKAIMNPFSYGAVTGTVVIEHDMYAQSTVTVNLTGTGVRSAVLFAPSVVDFGEWLMESMSSGIKVEIKNPLSETITLATWNSSTLAAPFSFGPAFSNALTYAIGDQVTYDGSVWVCKTTIGSKEEWNAAHWTKVAGTGVTIKPGESTAFFVYFTPTTTPGTYADTVDSTRTMIGKRSRLRMSQPLDPSKWDHDFDWIDLDQGDSFSGAPVALVNYDDAAIAFKESEIMAVRVGGTFGFYTVSLTLGKGVGALNQQSVCAGDGSLFWPAKTGIYQLTGQTVKPIHQDRLEDIIKAISASDFASARAVFYDHHYIFTAPLPDDLLDLTEADNKRYWAYNVPGDSWWPLSGTATAMAVKRGVTDKPSWWAFQYKAGSPATYPFTNKDADPTAAVDFYVRPGLVTVGEPGYIKFLDSVVLHTDRPAQFAGDLAAGVNAVEVMSDNGDTVLGVINTPATIILDAGVGVCRGGVLTDTSKTWAVDALIGTALELGRVTYSGATAITDNTANTLTYPGTENGRYSYRLVAGSMSRAIPVPFYLRECFGGAFDLIIRGKRPAAPAWVTATLYSTPGQIVSDGLFYYYNLASHTSGATTEPGVGANWRACWGQIAGLGTLYGFLIAFTAQGDRVGQPGRT